MRNLYLGSIWFSVLALGPHALVAQKVDFVKDVAPILASRCIKCHGAEDPEADLRLDIKAGLFHDSKEDWVVIPGKSKASELYQRISLPADDEDIMPAEGKPLTGKQVELVRRWIDEGANWPGGADAKLAAMLESSKPKVEKIDLPKLSKAQLAAEDAAFAAIAKAGGLAMRVAADTEASEMNLSLLAAKATNEHVGLASGLADTLIRLNLSRTKVDDAGLATVAELKHLRWLNLAKTAITDAGLEHVSGLGELRYLNLYGTAVTDRGLEALRGLKKLKKLYLWQTKVSKRGAAALCKALPELKVDRGEYAAVLARIKPRQKTVAKAPINKTCPVSNKPVDPSKTSVYQGQVIGFCCGKCKARFDKNPAACIGKVKEFAKATGPVANAKCPVSGKAVDSSKVSPFRGKLIGFCCGKCKAAFDKNPDKYLPKLGAVFGEPRKGKARKGKARKGKARKGKARKGGARKGGARKPPRTGKPGPAKTAEAPCNATCPVSGKPVDSSKVSTFRGKVIGFCCGKCKAAFDRNPDKYLPKLGAVFGEPQPGAKSRRRRSKK